MEIRLLKEEVKTLFSTTEILSKRICELENAQRKPVNSDSKAEPSPHSMSDLTLLTGQLEQRVSTLAK